MSKSKPLDYDVTTSLEHGIGIVTFQREPLNFFDSALVRSMSEAATELDEDTDCNIILIRSVGKVFCGGAFLREAGPHLESEFREIYKQAYRLFTLQKPVVALVQGPAIGGGLGLALAADFRIAGDNASFCANFSKLGIHCGFGISDTLPRTVGEQSAKRLLLTGRSVNTPEAVALGLVDHHIPGDNMLHDALFVVREIGQNAPLALTGMKRSLNNDRNRIIESIMDSELLEQARCLKSRDFQEGVDALLNNREPVFRGR